MAKSQKAAINIPWQKWMAGVLVLILYVPSILWMWDRWFTRDSYYSHGILIPFVSAYLIWEKRDVLKKIKPQTSRWGMALIILGILVDVMSALFRVYFTGGFSLLLVLYGLVLYFYGAKFLKEIFFPVSFLAFMVPLPEVIITNLSFRLKLLAAQIAVGALNNMGLHCVRDGSAIVMHHAYVVVEDVCSGLRSLITLMALGSLFAYKMKGRFAPKTILFVSTIPIAVLANVLRIIFLASVSEIWGTRYAMGPLHETSGFIVFLGAFGMLYVVQKMIE